MGSTGRRWTVEELFDAYSLALYRYAFRLSGLEADAQDLTQETFCKAQQQLRQLRDPDRAKQWLYSILRNAYLHKIRAQKNHRLVSLDSVGDLPEAAAEAVTEVEPDRLQQALNDLREEFRTPIILFYFEDFSYRDIAEQMDLPLGTVMSRLARAKAYLRDRLRPVAPGRPAEPPRRVSDGL
jgi:RNA polymerase sigma-70 factor (ECF subfamily)